MAGEPRHFAWVPSALAFSCWGGPWQNLARIAIFNGASPPPAKALSSSADVQLFSMYHGHWCSMLLFSKQRHTSSCRAKHCADEDLLLVHQIHGLEVLRNGRRTFVHIPRNKKQERHVKPCCFWALLLFRFSATQHCSCVHICTRMARALLACSCCFPDSRLVQEKAAGFLLATTCRPTPTEPQ